jgi:hypothetical protein
MLRNTTTQDLATTDENNSNRNMQTAHGYDSRRGSDADERHMTWLADLLEEFRQQEDTWDDLLSGPVLNVGLSVHELMKAVVVSACLRVLVYVFLCLYISTHICIHSYHVYIHVAYDCT